MKIGINALLWTANLNFKEHESLLEHVKELGYDIFETSVGGMNAKEIDLFARKAQAIGLTMQCTDLLSAPEYDIISDDERVRDAAVRRLKDSICKARDMGSAIISGPFFQGLGASSITGPTKNEWNWAVSNLRECAEHAKKCNVIVAAEPLNRFEMHILNTISDAVRMCEEIGCENFGILADTHHSNIEEYDVVDSYVENIDRIFNIHISENNRGIPGCGHGIPDNLFRALKDNGYKGNLVIEAFNANVPEILHMLRIWKPFAKSEDEIAIKGYRYIKEQLEKLEA